MSGSDSIFIQCFQNVEDPRLNRQKRHSLLDGGDPFKVLEDFQSYSDAQEAVDQAFRDKQRWARMAILNTARVGKFSSDRTISEYAKQIWKLDPIEVE